MQNKYYPHIFEPITINGVTFKNRIFTAPSMGHMIQNNAPTYPEAPMIANYLEKAKGGAARWSAAARQVNDPAPTPSTPSSTSRTPLAGATSSTSPTPSTFMMPRPPTS